MNFRNTDMCQACLNKNRRIYPLSKLQYILKEFQFFQLHITRGICWECRNMILKIQKFKNQVVEAQKYLNQHSEPTYLGSLSTVIKKDFDYIWSYDTDSVINNNEIEDKLSIKDESNDYVDDNLDYDICLSDEVTSLNHDGKLGEHMVRSDLTVKEYLDDEKDMISSKKTSKRVKSKLKKVQSKTAEQEFNEKFATVTLTEEEMVRNREEKRNQPNFKKIPFKCDSCVLGFTRRENYDLHCMRKHDVSIGPHVCSVCETRFLTPRALSTHQGRHYTVHRCRLCRYETLQRGSALAHCGAKHPADTEGRIHCGQCGFVAGTPDELAVHRTTQHSLTCNECGDKFKGSHTLRTHKIRIHTNRAHACAICRKSFTTPRRLEAHSARHAAPLARSLAYCAPCGVQYANIYAYRHHVGNSPRHTERLYQCQDCDKRFSSKVYWRKHRDFYHLNKSRFKCHICDKLLISRWRLDSHMQTRHGRPRTRDHRCHVCGNMFYTRSTLRAHQLTHSTQRSYMCERCGDTFRQRAALHTHARTLHATRDTHATNT